MAAFDVSFLNPAFRPPLLTDPETGCKSYDRVGYEACRQTFYLKQQAEASQKISTNNSGSAQTLQKLIEQQNNQVNELIQDSRQDAQRINSLSNSLNASYLFNMVLGVVILGIFGFQIFSKFRKRRSG